MRHWCWGMTVVMLLLVYAFPVCAQTYELLTGDDSTFDSSVGGWIVPSRGFLYFDPQEGHAAAGSAKVEPEFYLANWTKFGLISSQCLNIASDWPADGGHKYITVSAWAENDGGTAEVALQAVFYESANCQGAATTHVLDSTSSATWAFLTATQEITTAYGASVQVEFEVTGDTIGVEEYAHIDDVRAYSTTATAVRIADVATRSEFWNLLGLMVGLLTVIRLSKKGRPMKACR